MLKGRVAWCFLGGIIISVSAFTFSLQKQVICAEYKERLHSNTWEKRLKGTPDAENPDCLKCHATALGEKIAEVGKKYIPNVACEACHGAGSEQKKLKENYEGKGKDAFKELLKKDPFTARKVQYDAGLIVAGINGYATVKEQCLIGHWERKDDKNK